MHFFHTGDLGDIIACLPTIRELGGGELTIGHIEGPGYCRESMAGSRYASIKPLLEAQSYIKAVYWGNYVPGQMIDFASFRDLSTKPGEDLATRQARYVGTLISLEPWLEASASPLTQGMTVVARSGRYHNPNFDWSYYLKDRKTCFVGLSGERKAFDEYTGNTIYHMPTDDLLELAQLIKGSDLFIGNQSCPFWIAAGLGHPLIQESSPKVQDSIIQRPNASYPFASCMRPSQPQ